MNEKFEKLKTLLKELFQLDQPDLDFGLYRIMHAKAAEVTQFLDEDLLPQVKEAFGLYRTADKAELEKARASTRTIRPRSKSFGSSSPAKRWMWARWRTRSMTTCSASFAATTPR